jgi:hypothetical protein
MAHAEGGAYGDVVAAPGRAALRRAFPMTSPWKGYLWVKRAASTSARSVTTMCFSNSTRRKPRQISAPTHRTSTACPWETTLSGCWTLGVGTAGSLQSFWSGPAYLKGGCGSPSWNPMPPTCAKPLTGSKRSHSTLCALGRHCRRTCTPALSSFW